MMLQCEYKCLVIHRSVRTIASAVITLFHRLKHMLIGIFFGLDDCDLFRKPKGYVKVPFSLYRKSPIMSSPKSLIFQAFL